MEKENVTFSSLLFLLYFFSSYLIFLRDSVKKKWMLLLQSPLGWFSFILPFALVLPTQSPVVVFFHLLKSLCALILFPGLFLYLLQFPGCIAEVQIYIILIGRNFLESSLVEYIPKAMKTSFYSGPAIWLLKIYPKEISFLKRLYDFCPWPQWKE